MSEETLLTWKKPRKFAFPALVWINLILAATVIALAFTRTKNSRIRLQGLTSVVAKVNGRPLFARDLLSAAQLTRPLPDPKKLRLVLDRLIRVEVVAQQIPETAIAPGNIETLLETTGHQFGDLAARNSALTTAGLTEESLRGRFTRQIRVENWLRENATSHPTEEECRTWLLANPEIAKLPEVVQASHFAAIYPPRATLEEQLAKSVLINDAESRLKEGISFPQLIDALSDDPAKKVTHGSLFWFRRDRLESALIDTAFAQSLSKISKPLETRFGFHLLLVSEHHPTLVLPYEQIALEVHRRCRDEQERKKIDAIVTDLLQRAKVEILDPQLRTVTL